MQIVDAQIHLWGSGLPSNRAHRQVTAFPTKEAVGLMDAGGVDAAVIHPPGWDPGATTMAFAAVRDYPGRFAIMGALPLDRPESRALVANWRSQPGMLGLRYGFLQEPLRGWLEDGTLDWLWAAAERAGVPIAMLATDSLPAIGRIAARYPGLRLTIDHLGGRGGNTTLKDAAANPGETAALISSLPAGCEAYSGDDLMTLPLLASGVVGTVGVATHWTGEDHQEMFDLWEKGDTEGARLVNSRMLESFAFETGDEAPNPIPTKAMMRHLGIPVGQARLPMGNAPEFVDSRAPQVLANLQRWRDAFPDRPL